jgi:hypothetical protein
MQDTFSAKIISVDHLISPIQFSIPAIEEKQAYQIQLLEVKCMADVNRLWIALPVCKTEKQTGDYFECCS